MKSWGGRTRGCPGSGGSGPTRSCIGSENKFRSLNGQAGHSRRPGVKRLQTELQGCKPSRGASDPVFGPGAVCFLAVQHGTYDRLRLYPGVTETRIMLVERGIQLINVEVVGDAYAIASNYLRKSGAIPDTFATDERLIEIIVQMFQRGEYNKIRLANKAIVKFEAETFIA